MYPGNGPMNDDYAEALALVLKPLAQRVEVVPRQDEHRGSCWVVATRKDLPVTYWLGTIYEAEVFISDVRIAAARAALHEIPAAEAAEARSG